MMLCVRTFNITSPERVRYDRSGNRLSLDGNGSGNGVSGGGAANWDETYSYDGLNRLVAFNRGTYASGGIATPKFQQVWSLDALGNWRGFTQTDSDTTLLPAEAFPSFRQARTANAANEIGTIAGGGYAATTYDAAGNLTAGPKTGAVATQLHLVYDGWNRQSGYDANGDGDLTDAGDYRYGYDGTGRRVTKFQDTQTEGAGQTDTTPDNADGTTEEYYYNEDYQLLEVRVGTVTGSGTGGDTVNKTINANPKERYLWDLSYVDAPAMIELDTNTDGVRDYRLWPTFDANFNVTGVLSDQGVTVERYAYTPYGERTVINGDQNYANTGADPDGAEWTVDTTGSDFGVLLGFQGLRQDAETGTWQQRARYNSPVAGFQQRDPLGTEYQDGLSLYQLVEGNPLKFLDSSGLEKNSRGGEVNRGNDRNRATNGGYRDGKSPANLGQCPDPDRGGAEDLYRLLADGLDFALGFVPFGRAAQDYNQGRKKDAVKDAALDAALIGGAAAIAKILKALELRRLLSAGEELDRGGLTKAGRALEKHGGRSGSRFPKATGSVLDKNQQGKDMLNKILRSPNNFSKPNRFGGIDIRDRVSGRGVRYDSNGKMITFLD